jgi:hypothetical protein
MKRMPTTRGPNTDVTTAEYGISAMCTASRVLNGWSAAAPRY